MRCPYCDNESTNVVDTRESSDSVRRRRECPGCDRRFTTYETAEKFDIEVVKRDGSSEDFESEKIRSGIEKAVENTSLDEKDVDEMVDNVKRHVRGEKQIESKVIGDQILEELKKRDEVAYIRFASVYESFEDAKSFQKEVEALQKNG